jgi:patatin-like phospholipase/acyl hydrolase
MQAKHEKSMDVQLSEVCLGSSAAPTYLPPRYFSTTTELKQVCHGTSIFDRHPPRTLKTSREYNLVDGGVAVNNPVSRSLCNLVQCILSIFNKFEGDSQLLLTMFLSDLSGYM